MTIIGIAEAQDLLADSTRSITVIDVRHDDEFEAGHLRGATLIDVTEDSFADRITALDPAAEYLVYCGMGGRSAKAAEILTTAGFEHVHDLEGGITAWLDADMPVEK